MREFCRIASKKREGGRRGRVPVRALLEASKTVREDMLAREGILPVKRLLLR